MMGEMGPLDDAMINGTPWYGDVKLEVTMGAPWRCSDELGPIDNVMGNQRSSFWWHDVEIGSAMENLGPFALWWCNGEIRNPYNKAIGETVGS